MPIYSLYCTILTCSSGSGGTNNSASSRGHNDNSSSSARFSSTSTLPSSTDLPLDENTYSNAKTSHDIPAPPIPESQPSALRAAGRAFSFGRKKAGTSPLPPTAPRPVEDSAHRDGYTTFSRQRAMTENSYASESTTTPPKLLEGGLEFDDGFSSMFESFGKRQSKVLEEPPPLGGVSTESPVCCNIFDTNHTSWLTFVGKHVSSWLEDAHEIILRRPSTYSIPDSIRSLHQNARLTAFLEQ